MKSIKATDLSIFLDENDKMLGNVNVRFNNIQTSELVNEESLDWINPLKKNKVEYLTNSKARIIICDNSFEIPNDILSEKCIIIVKNPKLTFLRIANAFFLPQVEYGIHPSATIHQQAIISDKAYVGPNTYIGRSVIGDHSVIYGNCHIYDNVTIGNHVIIHAGTVIGADGFGYQRNKNGEFEKFPHIGGVIIKDHVDIGANTCIDRGALGNTFIDEGAKIDNLVHIAHNVKVGKHSAVIAHAMVGGSTVIGDYSWVAPSVALRDQIQIGHNSTVGMGAVVTKSIPDGETWTGSPAKPLSEFMEQQKKFKAL